MNIHIALYKWKPAITSEEINGSLATIEELADKVAGVIQIRATQNTSKYADGYSHVIFVRAKNQRAIDSYLNHPDHIRVAKLIEAMEEQSIGIDFETE
jgi:hypothetical protein